MLIKYVRGVSLDIAKGQPFYYIVKCEKTKKLPTTDGRTRLS